VYEDGEKTSPESRWTFRHGGMHFMILTGFRMVILVAIATVIGIPSAYLIMPFTEPLPTEIDGYGHLKKKVATWIARHLRPYHLRGLDGLRIELDYYLGWCEDHGYFVDYEHGFAGRTYIRCPGCVKLRRPTRATRVISQRESG
jgi:hypothetical protein